MALRLGVSTPSSFNEALRHPQMKVLPQAVSQADWESIVSYYLEQSPDSLPAQVLPAEPQLDPAAFRVGPFVPGLQNSAIITLLKTDSVRERIFVGEAGDYYEISDGLPQKTGWQ